ncbi:MAG: cytochrome c [Hymenobacteraceae bacterium]|nr:cytochrome c [Hymenobacteraceae bacterium]
MTTRLGSIAHAFGRLLGLVSLGLTASVSGCFTSHERGGQALYEQHCGNCHGLDGRGLGTLIPPLAGADYLVRQRTQLPCVVRRGMRGALTVNGQEYNGIMPGLAAEKLADADVANILNYVRQAWGNEATDVITSLEVANARCE